MKIDVFPHIFPKRFFDRMCEVVRPRTTCQKRTRAIPGADRSRPALPDNGPLRGIRAVLTLCSPPLETYAGPELAADLARLANDAWRRSSGCPRQLPGFVAVAPDEPPRRGRSRDRPRHRRAGGYGRPDLLERQRSAPRRARVPAGLERMASHRLPIWLHPARPSRSRLQGRSRSSTTSGGHSAGLRDHRRTCAPRFDGLFERWRTSGSSRITWARWFRTSRAGRYGSTTRTRTDDPDDLGAARRSGPTGRPLPEVLRRHRAFLGASHAMECGLAFFGADTSSFGTDMPSRSRARPRFIAETSPPWSGCGRPPRRRRRSTRGTPPDAGGSGSLIGGEPGLARH